MPDGSQIFIPDEAEIAQMLLPPEAPMAMPPQVLEHQPRQRWRWLRLLALSAR
jgi:hypothetical protein